MTHIHGTSGGGRRYSETAGEGDELWAGERMAGLLSDEKTGRKPAH